MAVHRNIEIWPETTPKDLGMRADMPAALERMVAAGELPHLHALLIARKGQIVLERYLSGPDQRWGIPLGIVRQAPDLRHDLRSITKSIVGLLYGIALEDGQAPPVTTRMLDLFPEYPDLRADPLRRRITIAHALSMQMGTAWDEAIPYSDPSNSERAMEVAMDRYRFILDRPMIAKPGATWVYNGGATALLAHVIARATQEPLLDYAQRKLFAPLGIADAEWVLGSNGEPAAASGLRLRLRDLAKIGQMVLNGGGWGERQIAPSGWLKTSFRPRAAVEPGLEYGYQWWLGRLLGSGKRWMAAYGNGGQRLWIIPGFDLIVAIFGGNYNAADQWKTPVAIMSKVVAPALPER